MNKKITFFLLAMAGTALIMKAQPTITSSTAGSIGHIFSFDQAEADDFDPGAAGSDVTWDFSAITMLGTSIENEYVDPSDTPYASDFPGANIAVSAGDGNYAYYKITSSEYTLYGAATLATIIYYSDPEEYYVFPMTYGTTNSDDLYSEFFSGSDFIRSGSNVTTADGYGTLILPSGTYTDVLRVKIEQDYMDEVVGLPFTLNYETDLFYWFKEGVTGPLLQYFHLNYDGSVAESVMVNADISVAAENLFISENVKVFPNPSSDRVTLKGLRDITMKNVEVYDATGILVKEFSTEVSGRDYFTMDISDLTAGMYVIRLQTDAYSISKNIIVQ
ncbi:MAG: T9SS type A sorting domain-containing protein [Chitinophagales bacterium]|nr:T9SS type A sorting domain-containing protein [Chitinophagales bacterium]